MPELPYNSFSLITFPPLLPSWSICDDIFELRFLYTDYSQIVRNECVKN